MIGQNTLISRDSKGKIRVVEISYQWEDDHNGFVIRRYTSQYGGKITTQPEIVISKGKAKRTVTEQARLEYNSHLKKYQDKGYKLLDKEISKYSKEDLDKILPTDTTDANGMVKPMLAKDFNKVASSALEKKWLASRKIDGVRCLMYYKDGEVHTASRGGQHYDYSTKHITGHSDMIKLFEENPDIILDGELYIHGRPLQYISGLARLETDVYSKCEALEYWIYDIVDPNLTFEDRLEMLEDVVTPYFQDSDIKVVMVEHAPCEGWSEIKTLHDKYVSEGFEGVVIRNPNKTYGINKRTNDMIKVKSYLDDCFKVVDKEPGLRGSEDMVFILETQDGKRFKAKPFGDRDLKKEYWENFESKYKGKIGECKFFYYSEDGIPLQPSFKAFRDDLE